MILITGICDEGLRGFACSVISMISTLALLASLKKKNKLKEAARKHGLLTPLLFCWQTWNILDEKTDKHSELVTSFVFLFCFVLDAVVLN